MKKLVMEAHGLRKSFGSVNAVNGIDLSLGAGETVGLLGPNGAGKTTTLLMLLGAITPDSGTVKLMGHELPHGRSEAMMNVGFAAGYLPMPDRLTVTESLRFFARLEGIRKPKPAIDAVLSRLQINHLGNAAIDTLSSGQRTLVGIAKAVIHRPALLVLDEPTASLDPDVADRVRTAVMKLNQEDGVTLLITSHDMPEVEQLCERVLFVSHGRVVADNNPRDLAESYGQADLKGVFLQVAREQRESRKADLS